jgi:threonine/homoserine/homoserine lactone efflux protein
MLIALLLGFVLGFLGSIPIAGPVAAMVLERAATRRAREARAIAMGAALAESGYALMAFWGLTTVLSRFPRLLPASRFVGASMFVAIGCYFLLRKGKAEPNQPGGGSSSGGAKWLLGFLATALNPTLLLTWTTVITALHTTGLLRTEPIDALPFAGGAGAGIITWFCVLLWIVRHFHKRVPRAWIDRTVRVMGGVFVLAGIAVGIHLVLKAFSH